MVVQTPQHRIKVVVEVLGNTHMSNVHRALHIAIRTGDINGILRASNRLAVSDKFEGCDVSEFFVLEEVTDVVHQILHAVFIIRLIIDLHFDFGRDGLGRTGGGSRTKVGITDDLLGSGHCFTNTFVIDDNPGHILMRWSDITIMKMIVQGIVTLGTVVDGTAAEAIESGTAIHVGSGVLETLLHTGDEWKIIVWIEMNGASSNIVAPTFDVSVLADEGGRISSNCDRIAVGNECDVDDLGDFFILVDVREVVENEVLGPLAEGLVVDLHVHWTVHILLEREE